MLLLHPATLAALRPFCCIVRSFAFSKSKDGFFFDQNKAGTVLVAVTVKVLRGLELALRRTNILLDIIGM